MQVRNDVGSELITLKGSVSAAIELIGEPTSKNQSIANVSALYSELKINLVARCKELERLDNAGKLNEDEEFILLPAIRE
ncbi:hypothetical protein, partial [Vibrio natriegens]|uniref:hypothetical protein n=1 Tax=Vibrio natriegens TaxID=691 RepID=UPI002E34D5E1